MLIIMVFALVSSSSPPCRFVVVTQPRSGSTWFVKFSGQLAKSNGVLTLGEVMHPEIVERKGMAILGKNVSKLGTSDYVRYLQGIFDELERGDGWSGAEGKTVKSAKNVRAVGFKLMYHQLPEAQENAILPGASSMLGHLTLEALLRSPLKNALFVHLVRVNHLERFITVTAITTFNLPYHNHDGEPTSYSFSSRSNTRLLVDPTEAFNFAYAQAKQNDDVENYLKSACQEQGADCTTIYYENLIRGGNSSDFRELRRKLQLDDYSSQQETPHAKKKMMIPCAKRLFNWRDLEQHPLLGQTVWVAMCLNGDVIPPDEDRYGNYSLFVKATKKHQAPKHYESSYPNYHHHWAATAEQTPIASRPDEAYDHFKAQLRQYHRWTRSKNDDRHASPYTISSTSKKKRRVRQEGE